MNFYIGERVRVRRGCRPRMEFLGEGEFQGAAMTDGLYGTSGHRYVAIKLDSGSLGGDRRGYWLFYEDDLYMLESCQAGYPGATSLKVLYNNYTPFETGIYEFPYPAPPSYVRFHYDYHYEDKPKASMLLTKFKNLFATEPTKSFRKLGVINDEGFLTNDGKDLLLNWLLKANGDAFNTEVVQPLLAEKKDEK